jgi:nitrogen fixation protein FixH
MTRSEDVRGISSLGTVVLGAHDGSRAGEGRFWAWVPGCILVGLLGAQLVVLANVLDDPASAVERDYYQKALDWDAHQARQRQSHALGWQVLSSTVVAPRSGDARLRVRLLDASGSAVAGARIDVLGFPNARSSQIRQLVLAEVSPGAYEAELGPARAGLWEFRLNAVRDADVFEQALRLELPLRGKRP